MRDRQVSFFLFLIFSGKIYIAKRRKLTGIRLKYTTWLSEKGEKGREKIEGMSTFKEF